VIVGAVASTVTTKLQAAPSGEDVVLTAVVPTGKKDPERGVLVTVPQVPNVSGAGKVTNAPGTLFTDSLATAVMLFGQLSVQAPPVAEVTVADAVALLSLVFESFVALLIVAVLVINVPPAVPAFTI
jgi:hypothetical protein